ncbi:MAG: RidA family protein [Candidatus Zixiibacteriota bacterium]
MKRVSSGSPYEKLFGFSRAVRVGDVIHVSGTAPMDDKGNSVHQGNAYLQAKRCLEIIAKAIDNAGGRLDQVVRTRVYVTDISKADEVGRAHGEFFGEIRPASLMIEVKGFVRKEWLVEIEAECWVGADESD